MKLSEKIKDNLYLAHVGDKYLLVYIGYFVVVVVVCLLLFHKEFSDIEGFNKSEVVVCPRASVLNVCK